MIPYAALRQELADAHKTIADLRVQLTLATRPDEYWRGLAAKDRATAQSAMQHLRGPDRQLLAAMEDLHAEQVRLQMEIQWLRAIVEGEDGQDDA